MNKYELNKFTQYIERLRSLSPRIIRYRREHIAMLNVGCNVECWSLGIGATLFPVKAITHENAEAGGTI